MARYLTRYAINVALSNGDIFCRNYDYQDEARDAFDRMVKNPLCIACELVGIDDETLADFERR